MNIFSFELIFNNNNLNIFISLKIFTMSVFVPIQEEEVQKSPNSFFSPLFYLARFVSSCIQAKDCPFFKFKKTRKFHFNQIRKIASRKTNLLPGDGTKN